MGKEKPILSVRVRADLLERLDRLCAKAGVGRAEMVERCLDVGLVDEEQFVRMLESPVKGSLAAFLLNPRVLNAVFSVTGQQVDEVQQQIKANVRRRVQSAGVRGRKVEGAR